MIDIQLRNCIAYLRDKLRDVKLWGTPSDVVLVESAIRYLEELSKIKEREVSNGS
jgi:translation initiation factor IF-1